MSTIRFSGSLAALDDDSRAVLWKRTFSLDGRVAEGVARQLAEVRTEGDSALFRYAEQFDHVTLRDLEVPRAELERALRTLDPAVRRGLERAANNLECVARATLPGTSQVEVEPGVTVGRRADPLTCVGIYAPGGTAVYPSSVLMGVVPARVAGVPEILVCSPPAANGQPSDLVLAAACLAGATRVFALGGAGAIAALAYGTRSVPKVDRITGPGNAWVAEAKRQVAGDVGIDAPAGPSEILVVADESANPVAVACELLAQAEHDADACVAALCLGEDLAARVRDAVLSALPRAPRRRTIAQALERRGAVLTIGSLAEAWPFVAAFAPEHLQLNVADAECYLSNVRNAGTVFVGASTSVAFGDYLTGANHVLPTAGAARRCSGLSVLDFVRWQTWQRVTPAAARALCADVETLANCEGLPAHARAAAAATLEGMPTSRSVLRTRTALATVQRYTPLRPPCAVDLTDNTNQYGVPPAVSRILADPPATTINRYPSPYADALRRVLAEFVGVPIETIVTGCGSDDVLDATFRAFGDPGDRVAYCPPTFGIVAAFAQQNGLLPVSCPLEVGALVGSGARIIYLCDPNNPTGAALPAGLVDQLLARTNAVIVLDEAYVEYATRGSLAARAPSLERLLVVRTLSKAFGLAGLRIGYAVGAPQLVAQVEKTRGPYKVGGLTEACAVAVLTEDQEWVRRGIDDVKVVRSQFVTALQSRGFSVAPSEANFVLVPVPGKAIELAARMREAGVSVRAFEALPGIGEAVRISIGPRKVMDVCLCALTEAVR
jgi:histidinol dehydrogenase